MNYINSLSFQKDCYKYLLKKRISNLKLLNVKFFINFKTFIKGKKNDGYIIDSLGWAYFIKGNSYTRLISIGILSYASNLKDGKNNNEETKEFCKSVASKIDFPIDRTEKDISIYMMNIEKIEKAMELIKINTEETIKRRKGINNDD